MKVFLAIVALVSIVTAFPAPIDGNEAEGRSFDNIVRDVDANCQAGVDYCYQQIVQDLAVPKQTILHQYCDQQFEYDALSCHGCKKVPWPLDYCWDGPGAWNSVFTCESGQNYTFKERCNWCEAGKCV